MLEIDNLYMLFRYIRTEENRMNVTDPLKFLVTLMLISLVGQACGWF